MKSYWRHTVHNMGWLPTSEVKNGSDSALVAEALNKVSKSTTVLNTQDHNICT